jgi:prepilin-type N-terminal cleavage/methylation domain-containing protein
MKNKNRIRGQEGFTLIEIIAVLILLGILAAVAVPKFLDLQSDAQEKAIEGALAAASSNATLAFSKYLLTNGNEPSAISSNAWGGSVSIPTDLGDFTASYEFNNGTGVVTVTITDGPDWFDDTAATKIKTFTIN